MHLHLLDTQRENWHRHSWTGLRCAWHVTLHYFWYTWMPRQSAFVVFLGSGRVSADFFLASSMHLWIHYSMPWFNLNVLISWQDHRLWRHCNVPNYMIYEFPFHVITLWCTWGKILEGSTQGKHSRAKYLRHLQPSINYAWYPLASICNVPL